VMLTVFVAQHMMELLEATRKDHPEEKTMVVSQVSYTPIARDARLLTLMTVNDVPGSHQQLPQETRLAPRQVRQATGGVRRATDTVFRYQGDMTLADRLKAVHMSQNDEKEMILLMSLKAGGVGLNLTRGNRKRFSRLYLSYETAHAFTGVINMGEIGLVVRYRRVRADSLRTDLAWNEASEHQG
jgi:hypothetical protein